MVCLGDLREMNTWPRYKWRKYEVVDCGGLICLYWKVTGNDGISILPKNIPRVIKLLEQAYKNYKGVKKK